MKHPNLNLTSAKRIQQDEHLGASAMNSRPTLIVLLWLVSCVVAMNATAQTYVSLQSSSSPNGGYELYGLGAGGSGGGNGGELPSNGVVNIYFQPSNMTSGGAANENEAGVIGISNPIWNTYTEANAQSLKSNLQDELGNFTPVAFSNNAPVVAQCGETADTQSYFTSGTSGFFRGVLRLAGGGDPGEPCTNSYALSNLVPGNKYDLVLYATWNAADAGSKFTIDGVPKTCTGVPSVSTAALVEGQSYIRYDAVEADPQGEIHGIWETYRDSAAHDHRGPFNGIQIEGNFFNSIVIEFQATQLDLNPNTDQVTMFWNSKPGISYAVDYSDDHQQWVRRLSNLQAVSMETIVVFPEPGLNSVPSRTYRLVEE